MKKKISAKTLFIGSGKGGVGKSTLSVNLALALARRGKNVALLDADIYGPSIPIMFGLRRMSPKTVYSAEGVETVLPIEKFGLKLLSIGFFMEEARAANWRGPMLHSVLEKMTHGVEWGAPDYCLVDLPPGTGDVPLSLHKLIECDGALIVTTPQQVATLDALKAVNSFDTLQIPTLGIIENMAGFTPPGSETTYHLFGEGQAHALAESLQVPLLGSIPILEEIRAGGDTGIPFALTSDNLFAPIGEML